MKFKAKLTENKSLLFVGIITVIFGILCGVGVVDKTTPLVQPDLLTQIAYTMIMVVSLNLVVGFLGELSLGHAGFMYIGAYVSGIFMHYAQNLIPFAFLRLIAAMLLGGIAAAIFGFIIGLPALRLRGDYLAIVTLAFGEIIRGILKNIAIGDFITNPAIGFSIKSLTVSYSKWLFLIALVLVLITIFCIQSLVKSKHGRAIKAIRDNEIAARAMGINITYYKLIVFAIAAFFAGIAGGIFSSYTTVSYATFSYNYSIEILVMVVLGGMGSIFGSLISSIAIVFINVQLKSVLTGNLAGLKYFIYAIILIVMMIITSSPKLAPLREKLNWKYISGKIFKKKKSSPDVKEAE